MANKCLPPPPEPAPSLGKRLLSAGANIAKSIAKAIFKDLYDVGASLVEGIGHVANGEAKYRGPDKLLLGCLNQNFGAIEATGQAVRANGQAILANLAAIQANGQAIAQNAALIRENYAVLIKVDRKVDELFSRLESTEADLLKGMKESTMRQILSSLKTFLNDFTIRLNSELLEKRQGDKHNLNGVSPLEHSSAFMHFLRELMRPGTTGNLHALLNDIINQDLAQPESKEDLLKFIMLFMLINGLTSYVSMLETLNAQYGGFIEGHFDYSEMDEYSRLMRVRSDTYRDIGTGLAADGTGLIDRVSAILKRIALVPAFAKEKTLVRELSNAIDGFSELKKVITDKIKLQFIETPKRITVNPDFSGSQIETPSKPSWIAKRKVSYAILFQEEVSRRRTILSKWSFPYRVGSKACPRVTIPLDPQRRVRFIYRKFDAEPPQLVAIVTGHNVTSFVDIDREVFNIVRETSESAIEEMEPYLRGGANLNAVFEKGRTCLHMAAASGNLRLARYLLEHGAQVEVFDKNGYTALHNAAFKGAVKFVEGATSEGIMNPNVLSYQLNTPLHSAVIGHQAEVVSVLLDHSHVDTSLTNYQGLNPLHLAGVLGYEGIIDAYLNSKRILSTINLPTESGFTVLHLAILKKHADVALSLLENDSIDVNIQDSTLLSTPLHLAVVINLPEVAKKLLEKEAFVNVAGESESTALHFAVSAKNAVLVKLLLKYGADVTAHTTELQTPLHLSVLNYQAEVLRALLEADQAPVNQANSEGATPLYYALQLGLTDVVAALVAKCARATDLSRVNGKTQLHLASEEGHVEVVQGLIKLGADVNQTTDAYSKLPFQGSNKVALDLAVENGHIKVAKVLIEASSKVNFILYSVKGDKDWKASLTFLRNTKLTEDQFLQLVEILKKTGKNYQAIFTDFSCEMGFFRLVNAVNDDNITNQFQNCAEIATRYGQVELAKNIDKNNSFTFYLRWAVEQFTKNIEMFKYLAQFAKIKKFTTIFSEDNDKNSLLHLTVKYNHYEILKYIYDKIQNHFENEYLNSPNKNALLQSKMAEYLDALNEKGQTLLNLAVEHNADVKIVEFLLSAGAKPDLQNNEGKSNIYWAAKRGNLASVKLLAANGAKIDAESWTPLLAAISYDGNLELVRFLAEKGANLNRKVHLGKFTLANFAFDYFKNDIAEYLVLEKKVELNKVAFKRPDWSYLQEVSSRGSLKLVEFYLKEKNADLNAKDSEGRDALHCCALTSAWNKDNATQRLQIVQLLLESGGNIDSVDNEGISLLHRAILSRHSEIAVYLLEQGANFRTTSKTSKLNPLSSAIAANDLKVARLLLEKGQLELKVLEAQSLEMLQLLISYGADPLEKDPNGLTLFEIAIIQKEKKKKADNVEDFEEILRWFIFTFKSANGGTIAHEVQTLPALRCIVSYGGNLNGLNIKQETPLHVAVARNSSEAVSFLLEEDKCVNVRVKNIVHERAIDVAKRMKGNEKIRTLLSEKEEVLTKENSVRGKREVTSELVNDSPPSLMTKLFSSIVSSVNGFTEGISSLASSQLSYTTFRPSSIANVKNPNFANGTQNAAHNHNLNYSAPLEVNSTLLLLDVFTRKLTRVQYSFASNSNSNFQAEELDVRSYALNLTEQFERELEQIGSQYGFEEQSNKVNFFELFKEIEAFAKAEQWSEIELLLRRKLTLAYPQLEEKV